VTKQFLQDTGAKNSADLLVYTTNTEVGGLGGNFSSTGGGLTYNQDGQLLRPNNSTRVRGLDSADNTRDYFLSDIPWDGFNVDRVDLQRGPNSILFGIGSPAGIINTSVNTATFKNKNTIENRVGSFGSLRFSGDFNFVVIPNELAVRVSLLDDNTKYRQKPAYNHDKRVFGALRYTPKIFREGSNTSLRANFESGKVDANRPRTLPPIDTISPWFYTGTDGNGNLNLNKYTYSMATTDPQSTPFNNANRGAYPYAWLFNSAIGRQFWLDTTAYYGNNNDSTPTLFRQTSNGSQRWGINAAGTTPLNAAGKPTGDIQNLPGARARTVTVGSSYYTASGLPGGSYYADNSLSDPSIFDFYSNLIDGNNKYEWQKWKSSNIALAQTFFHDRLGFEGVYDYQRYQDGQRIFLGNSDTYKIGVDIVTNFANGDANPNVGRAFVANSDEQNNSLNMIDRDGYRFTTYGELRADDFLAKESTLARILGRHVFTGLLSQDTKRTFTRRWATSAASPEFTQFTGESDNLGAHFRSFNFVSYISGDLRGRSSAAGANLDRVRNIVKAPENALVRVFDNHWAKPLNPTDPNYVNPAAPYTYSSLNAGLWNGPVVNSNVSTQSENPANYGGWKDLNVRYLSADAGDIDALTYSSGRNREVISSKAVTWQGYLFDDAFVPVFGWRRDKLVTSSGSGVQNSLGIVTTNYNIDEKSQRVTYGENKSWGGILHVPAKWTSALPGNTTFSVFYNKSQNNRVSLRPDVWGNQIPNPSGKTKEYGVTVNTLDDKLTLKVTKYETVVANASLGGGNPLGGNSYYLWAVPVWGTAMVARDAEFVKGNPIADSLGSNWAATDDPTAPQRRLPNGDLNPAWVSHPSTQLQIKAIDAWRQLPVNQGFFNAYGNEVGVMNYAAIQAGNWTAADPLWSSKIDNQPASGGLVGFGGSGPVFTVDTLSKGYEFELTARPTKNWNVSVNASKTFATRTNLAPTMVAQIDAMTKFFAGPAGDYRWWGGGVGNAIRTQWTNNILQPYQTFKSQEGLNAPEIAPWRFNGVSTYNFDHGRFKGAFVGGAYRWEQARVLGYQFDQKLNGGLGALDVSKPWKGDSDSHFDAWVGYSRKLAPRINWRVQLNLRALGESKKLVPIVRNPNGAVAYSRIQEGMVWQLTNSFEF
ncbi:MAG: TonB-dependent receptor plug domain-containing protein, partial [Opitutus sp.]